MGPWRGRKIKSKGQSHKRVEISGATQEENEMIVCGDAQIFDAHEDW